MKNIDILKALETNLAELDTDAARRMEREYLSNSIYRDTVAEDSREMYAVMLTAARMVDAFHEAFEHDFRAVDAFREKHGKFPKLRSAFTRRHPQLAAA